MVNKTYSTISISEELFVKMVEGEENPLILSYVDGIYVMKVRFKRGTNDMVIFGIDKDNNITSMKLEIGTQYPHITIDDDIEKREQASAMQKTWDYYFN